MLHLAQELFSISSIRCCFKVAGISIIVTIQRLALYMKDTHFYLSPLCIVLIDSSEILLRGFHIDPVLLCKNSLLTLKVLFKKC